MTTPMLMTEHPTEELLAEFVDDRLDTATRAPVTEHLTSCGECREIVLMAAEYQMDEEPANVTHGNFGAGRWIAAIGSLAAAAVIAVMVVQPSSLFGPDVDDLIVAARGQKKRPSVGRLAGFAFNEQPVVNRGKGEKEVDVELSDVKLLEIAADLAEAKEKGKSPDPHVVGLSKLLIAENGSQVGEAAVDLDEAYEKARGEERDAIAIDLAAALIARASWSAGTADYGRAFELSNDVLKRQPKRLEALWNRAVALELLDRDNEAMSAWDDYLKVDSAPDSPWAQEAARRKARIESGF